MNKINGLIGNNGYTNSATDAKSGTRAPTSGTSGSIGSEETSVSLSAEATGMQQLTQQLASPPSFDQAKVDRIKSLIAQGQYTLDPAKIAARFHELESQ
ncbi:flagellar biosynthesis anti-sigma factor FlgM [Halothiobacillus sp. DCM-1]|uniref:flagellar biosynthesis anti-sigma factor FlgM n=1 Tax=Halothiobacillus sp. DCM-1 TaxID=3112558 RepID=UPI0032554A6D